MKKKIDRPVIKIENVSKIYQMGDTKVHALDGVDLDIYKGEFLAIMGPSGSGKSTLMNMVGVLDRPSCGKIYLEGLDINLLDDKKLAKIRGKTIGFIFQQFNLIQTLTALENVMLPSLFQDNQNQDFYKRKAIKYLELVELGRRYNHKPSELSGGQQQRVAIARALINDPDIILADEPTGNLDSKTGDAIMNYLKKLNKEGKTIVLITHEDEIAAYAKKKITLRDGKIIEVVNL